MAEVVIYTADVEYAEETYHLGSITLHVESAYLVNMNSNHIYQKLRHKIENHETLTEEELTDNFQIAQTLYLCFPACSHLQIKS